MVELAVQLLITAVRVRKHFIFRVPAKSLARILVCALLCGAAAFGCTLLPVNNLLRLVCAVAAGAAVYAVAIIASGEGRAEAQAVLKRLKR